MDFISENPESDHNIWFQSFSNGLIFLYNRCSQFTVPYGNFKLSLSVSHRHPYLIPQVPLGILNRSHNLCWLGLPYHFPFRVDTTYRSTSSFLVPDLLPWVETDISQLTVRSLDKPCSTTWNPISRESTDSRLSFFRSSWLSAPDH